MRYGQVQGIDKPVSRIVLGTMIINTREEARSFAMIDAAFEQGGTTLDTAHVYAGGDSERAIGRWMKARGNRDQVVVLTKGAHPNADRPRVTPYDITSDLYDSLARLQTDFIDLYMLHRDDPSVPVGPIVDVLNDLRKAGKIRAFGGSNWTHTRLQEANAYAAARGLAPFTASSPNFGLAEQVEDPWGPGCVTLSGPQNEAARAWYRAQRMPVFAYSRLGRGFFSGRITRENFPALKEILDGACVRAYCHEVNFRRLDRVEALARQKGVPVPRIALAYALSQPLDVFALVGAASGAEYQENLAALDLVLSGPELAWLDLRAEQAGGGASPA